MHRPDQDITKEICTICGEEKVMLLNQKSCGCDWGRTKNSYEPGKRPHVFYGVWPIGRMQHGTYFSDSENWYVFRDLGGLYRHSPWRNSEVFKITCSDFVVKSSESSGLTQVDMTDIVVEKV